ncbi:MAG: hypothetical protein EA356_10120 [Geminicoccaceae bacterium]|nr:MAG: hypothetical protein EA356_10120 [Geminicoccaceae bacterium]
MFGDVCRLRRPRGTAVAMVVVLQDAVHDDLATRLVAPLVRPETLDRRIAGLQPMVQVEGESWLVMIPLLGTLRADLIAAIDRLVTGV